MENQGKNFLEEGFDFIDESFYGAPENFQDTNEITISESSSTNSKFKILGVVKGCIAPIGELSRNGRLYENTHWQKVLKNPLLQERIANRKFFGMLSHENKKIDDRNFKAGEISHICSLLEVRNDDKGNPFLYGELEILDTPAGRILKAMYEGGAGLYVSTRAAGKLLEAVGKPYKIVDSDSYYIDSIDFVLNPGFLQAKPVFEQVEREVQKPQLHESKQDSNVIPESSEITTLKSQIDKLAKIVEKVVDDVYEVPASEAQPTNEEVQKQPIAEPNKEDKPDVGEMKEKNKEKLVEEMGNIINNELSDQVYEDVVAILQNSNPDLLTQIMENSRNKFNDEHSEKTGLEISYYRFGGNKPYKIVPKGTDYFAARQDSPRYRTLKQAQKHVLNSYNKPEKDTSEALADFVSLMADTNISEKAFEEIIDIIAKAKKED